MESSPLMDEGPLSSLRHRRVDRLVARISPQHDRFETSERKLNMQLSMAFAVTPDISLSCNVDAMALAGRDRSRPYQEIRMTPAITVSYTHLTLPTSDLV